MALGGVGLLAASAVLRAARGSPDREDAIRTLATNANLDAICTYAAILARPPSKLLHRAAAAKDRSTEWSLPCCRCRCNASQAGLTPFPS